MSPGTWVEVDGRRVALTHLERVLYPQTGFTKAEMIDYYTRVAPALLGQLADRPVTRIRFPQGVEGERFFEKNLPRGAPEWVRHHVLPASPGSEDEGTSLDLPVIDGLASLVWAANQGAIELHTPQWRVGPRGGLRRPDRLVVDLDPGPGTGLDECAAVARLVAERLRADGLAQIVPVTSGSKGLQLYAPLPSGRSAAAVHGYARELAHTLAAEHPGRIVSNQKRSLRPGKVLVDWSQNHPAKTTITPYSLRGRDLPQVAAPRRWEEIASGLTQIGPQDVLERLARDGDLMAVATS
ncbi:non-homologous end-joining DNA ligase [Actinotalea sp.]|uniref:non-homologous end-joining DNA ligase n=1 Tax=Actinotalea sp. TaxID=1872145 RepID=UPI003562F29B